MTWRPMPIRTFAILPAAGHSRRIGRPKLLLPLADGRALIDHVLMAWRGSSVDGIVVVMRRDDAPLAKRCAGPRTAIVQPDVDPPDMKSSIAAGIQYLLESRPPAADDAWLVAPADMPLLSAQAIDAVIAAYRQQLAARDTAHTNLPLQIVVPHHAGRRGHPCYCLGASRPKSPRWGPTRG